MSLFTPDEYLTSVDKVDLHALWDEGYRCLLLDMDNTLYPRSTGVVPPEVHDWLDEAARMGFKMCAVSNNWHDTVRVRAASLGLDVVYKAMKPLPFAFSRARRKMGCARNESVAIGDELFTDIFGANAARMRSILVVPKSTTDIKFTTQLRKLEDAIMGDMKPSR